MARPKRYEGLRWRIHPGRYDGVEKFALHELQREVQAWLPYVVEIGATGTDGHDILLGTPASNPRIADLVAKQWIKIPASAEGYAIRIGGEPTHRQIVIAGHDERGVLYGVEEFNATVLNLTAFPEPPTPVLLRKAFDELPDTNLTEHPAIQNRGLWTWGYVIYDYRRYIDNMARLKMNMLTIWNDCVPLNIHDIIAHAHSRGVKIILGFHWGWGIPDIELGKADDRQRIKDIVLQEYNTHYRDLPIDGIYFQTLTETSETESAGMPIADAACALVNDIAGTLLAANPKLLIQFGLHATSIRENLAPFTKLDPRVVITWEDAGNIPYTYFPGRLEGMCRNAWVWKGWGKELAAGKSIHECTREYSQRLATFRPGTEFAMVPKGWTCLRWKADFENHGPFILGERQPHYVAERLKERQPLWDSVNVEWPNHYGLAAQFYREVLAKKPPVMTVTGLVEDGLFEAAIQPSVGVFAQTIWNPHRPDAELFRTGNSPYYRKAQS